MLMTYHKSVLLNKTVAGLNIQSDGIYVDVTFGGGGHSHAILEQLGPNGKLIAFDQDLDALENEIHDDRFLLINENFRFAKRFLKFHGFSQVDGILADFGVSSHQFDEAGRGFSTRFDAVLDMRMNQTDTLSALKVVNEYEESQLRSIFYQYGELKQAPLFARTLVSARKNKTIETTTDLNEVLKKHLHPRRENKMLAQIYQAIRIEVNQEIEVLKEFLQQTPEILKSGGRLSFISYHSLEDRLVKRFFRNGLFEGEPEKDMFGNVEVPFKRIGKLIIPDENEISENPRARSAKLRIAEKI